MDRTGVMEANAAYSENDALLEEVREAGELESFSADRAGSPRVFECYIFLSVDLAGSTQFKQSAKNEWMEKTRIFYDVTKRRVAEKITRATIWKYIGDEIVFCKKISEAIEISEFVESAKQVVSDIASFIESSTESSPTMLSAKGVVWLIIAENNEVVCEVVEDAQVAGQLAHLRFEKVRARNSNKQHYYDCAVVDSVIRATKER